MDLGPDTVVRASLIKTGRITSSTALATLRRSAQHSLRVHRSQLCIPYFSLITFYLDVDGLASIDIVFIGHRFLSLHVTFTLV